MMLQRHKRFPITIKVIKKETFKISVHPSTVLLCHLLQNISNIVGLNILVIIQLDIGKS